MIKRKNLKEQNENKENSRKYTRKRNNINIKTFKRKRKKQNLNKDQNFIENYVFKIKPRFLLKKWNKSKFFSN